MMDYSEKQLWDFFEAAENNQIEKLQEYLDSGFNPNVIFMDIPILTYITNQLREYKESDVEAAKKTIQFLIERGVDLKQRGKDGLTASETAFQSHGKTEFGYFLRDLEKIPPEEHFKRLTDQHFPIEALKFLNKNRDNLHFNFSNENELSYVQLCTPEELRFTNITLYPYEYFDVVDEAKEDPNMSKDGEYVIPAIDIIRDCPDYDQWGILVWIPSLKLFATADTDHGEIHLFRNTSWDKIINNLESHCCYEWDQTLEGVDGTDPYAITKPWEIWEFIEY